MSWLARLFHLHPSPELEQAKHEAEVSKDRLDETLEVRKRVDRVAKSLERKQYQNGWGEVIAETMRRAK